MTKPRRRRIPDRKVHFTDPTEFPAFWLLKSDLRTSAKIDALVMKEGLLGVRNSTELDVRQHEIRIATNNWSSGNFARPDDFPLARVALSHTDFAPDYLDIGPDKFCSRRLRDVLALPQDVVQFLPIEVISGGNQARSQDYRKMHVLAQQPALDLERSGCVMKEARSVVTGETFLLIDSMERMVLLEGLQPNSDVFLVDEAQSLVLATDALAARVLQSGCTGMEFREPAHTWSTKGSYIDRYRTTTGIAERRVHFLD